MVNKFFYDAINLYHVLDQSDFEKDFINVRIIQLEDGKDYVKKMMKEVLLKKLHVINDRKRTLIQNILTGQYSGKK